MHEISIQQFIEPKTKRVKVANLHRAMLDYAWNLSKIDGEKLEYRSFCRHWQGEEISKRDARFEELYEDRKFFRDMFGKDSIRYNKALVAEWIEGHRMTVTPPPKGRKNWNVSCTAYSSNGLEVDVQGKGDNLADAVFRAILSANGEYVDVPVFVCDLAAQQKRYDEEEGDGPTWAEMRDMGAFDGIGYEK